MTVESIVFTVKDAEAGSRLDLFLAGRNPSISRSHIKKLIESGHAMIGGGAVLKAGRILKAGDIVLLEKPKAKEYDLLKEAIPLNVFYEDNHLIVIDKPAGMVVHPAAGHNSGTLVNALLYHCKTLSGISGIMRPGIVHRLDKETSGLMVVAKSDEAHRGLAEQFKRHEVEKKYAALVFGNPLEDEGFIDLPVGRHPSDRKKMSTKGRRSKEAQTSWRVVERYGFASLLEVDIKTGRTHQIRVHLTAINLPVVGDSTYGNPKRINSIEDLSVRGKLKGLKRQALHAANIGFFHPVTFDKMVFSSALPRDMADVCNFFREYINKSIK